MYAVPKPYGDAHTSQPHTDVIEPSGDQHSALVIICLLLFLYRNILSNNGQNPHVSTSPTFQPHTDLYNGAGGYGYNQYNYNNMNYNYNNMMNYNYNNMNYNNMNGMYNQGIPRPYGDQVCFEWSGCETIQSVFCVLLTL